MKSWAQGEKLNASDLNGNFTELVNRSLKFGGTGADGALTVSSGTTNIDLGGVKVFTKNYSSVSITGTGKITFSNPHANGTIVIFNVSGNLTVTSSTVPAIDFSGLGQNAGLSGDEPSSGARTFVYTANSEPTGLINLTDVCGGTNGWGGSSNYANGNYGSNFVNKHLYTTYLASYRYAISRIINIVVGFGGGNGAGSNNYWFQNGGGASSIFGTGSAQPACGGNGALNPAGPSGTSTVGGKGGGSFLFNVLGNVSISSTIYMRGLQGVDTASTNCGCGGGGSGGMGVILYAGTLTNSGTYDNAGGRGGNGGTVNGSAGGASYSNPVAFIPAII